MNGVTLRQKLIGGAGCLFVGLILMTLTAVALNGMTSSIASASVAVHQSADNRVVALGQQETLQRAIIALDSANDRIANVAELALQRDAGGQAAAQNSGSWFWWFCAAIIGALLVLARRRANA